MRECGAAVLAVEAGKTLIVDAAAFLSEAEEAGISVVGIRGTGSDPASPPR